MAGVTLSRFTLPQSMADAFTTGIFFGFYLITASFANRWLIFADEGWKLRRNIHWFMVVITNVIVVLSTAYAAMVVCKAMVMARSAEEGHKPGEFTDPPWVAILACTLANSIALLADIVLMYRLWVLHAKRMWVVWFPIFLWIGGVVCTILQVFLQVVHIHNPDFGPYQWAGVNMTVGPGIVLLPFWASTIAVNAYCTGILMWRIWAVSKKGENNTTSKQLRFLARILIESGILYLSISLAHFFVWFGHDNFAIHMLGSLNASVIGIAYNLIIIRTAQNRAEGEEIHLGAGQLTTIQFNSKPMISVEYTSSIETDDRTVYQTHGSYS